MSRLLLDVLPPKTPRLGAGARRRLVYLDQNVLSDLAKLELRRSLPEPRKAALSDLREEIRQAVGVRQDAICVESIFHRDESSGLVVESGRQRGAKQLFDEISRFIGYYSFRLQLSTCTEILQKQALLAVAERIGLELPQPDRRWHLALSRDPQKRNEEVGVVVGGKLFALGVEWVPTIYPTAPWADKVETMRSAGEFGDFHETLARAKREQRASIVRMNEFTSWSDRWSTYPPNRMPREPMDQFIASDDLFGLPMVHTRIQLYADVLAEKNRRFKDSDPNDIDILSAAVPYCDLVVTDAYMAQVAKRRGIDKAFGTVIVAGTNDGIAIAASALRSPAESPLGSL